MNNAARYDVVVVGAGPAGSIAAVAAARGGVRVVLLERKAQAGLPVRCGEGIGLGGLTRSLALDERWVRSRIRSVRLVSPSGTRVELVDFADGMILDRAVMERDLVKSAQDAGATYVNCASVVSVVRMSDGYCCSCADGREFHSSCVILAEGVESRLGRQLGWETSVALRDMETCAIARIQSESIDQSMCGFYLGSAIAPGGYAWVFPRGGHSANVGLGVLGSMHSPGEAARLLESFVAARFPGATVTDAHCGGVPVAPWVNPLVRDGALLVGDAARQVDCLHGGGLAYSLFAGKAAGAAAAACFGKGRFNPKGLIAYQRAWASHFGRRQRFSYALKNMVVGMSDVELDSIARALSSGKNTRITYLTVLLKACAGRPLLALKAFLMLC